MKKLQLALPGGKILAEFLLVVLGVLAALMVDTWIAQRNDDNLRTEYVDRLRDDLNTDLRNLDHRIGFFSAVREFGVQTLQRLDSDQPATIDAVVAAYYTAEIFAFAPINSTYEDLQNTGNLRLLGDIELRLALAEYYSRVAVFRENSAQDYREAVRGLIPWTIQAAIRANCPTTNVTDDVPTGFPPCSLPGISEQQAAAAINAIRAYPQMREILTYRISEVDVSVFLLRVQQQSVSRVLERL